MVFELGVYATVCVVIAMTVTAQVTDISVSSCTTLETEFSVLNAVSGGKAYIEGTTNDTCILDLHGNASDVTQLTFSTCGVTPTYLTLSNTLEFWVVVTETAYSNTNTDSRFHIRCLFQESTSNVDIQVEAETADKTGVEKKHSNIPQAVITLCKILANGSCEHITYSNLVVIGDELKLRFELDQHVPEYEMRVDECFFEAKDKQTAESVSSITLLDETTHCAKYPVFPDFTYGNESTTSDAGNMFETPVAENNFQAFIPLTVSRALALVNLDLVIGCKVSVCFRSTGCTLPSCAGTRRKRETGTSDPDVTGGTVESWLYDGYQMRFVNTANSTREADDNSYDVIPEVPRINDVCLDKSEFWAIILGLLFLLLCVCGGFCCFMALTRRRHNAHYKEKLIYAADDVTSSYVTKTTSISPSAIKTPSQPPSVTMLTPSPSATMETSSLGSSFPTILPRYVPGSLKVLGQQSKLTQ